MRIKNILSFVKIEHTLFSLPFVLIGYFLAYNQFMYERDNEFGWLQMDLVWILIAAIGARGLAMTLNRIIDREIDAVNPRTASRHLVSGSISINTAWMLSIAFLSMLLLPMFHYVLHVYVNTFFGDCVPEPFLFEKNC